MPLTQAQAHEFKPKIISAKTEKKGCNANTLKTQLATNRVGNYEDYLVSKQRSE